MDSLWIQKRRRVAINRSLPRAVFPRDSPGQCFRWYVVPQIRVGWEQTNSCVVLIRLALVLRFVWLAIRQWRSWYCRSLETRYNNCYSTVVHICTAVRCSRNLSTTVVADPATDVRTPHPLPAFSTGFCSAFLTGSVVPWHGNTHG